MPRAFGSGIKNNLGMSYLAMLPLTDFCSCLISGFFRLLTPLLLLSVDSKDTGSITEISRDSALWRLLLILFLGESQGLDNLSPFWLLLEPFGEFFVLFGDEFEELGMTLLLLSQWVCSLSGKSERPQLLQGSGTLSFGSRQRLLELEFEGLLVLVCFPKAWIRISGSFLVSSIVFLILFFSFLCLK